VKKVSAASSSALTLTPQSQVRWFVRSERIDLEIASRKLFQPSLDQLNDNGDLQIMMVRGVFQQISHRQLEQSGGRTEPFFLQVNEGARELNQSFVKCSLLLLPHRQPQLLQHIVRLIVETAIKQLEIPEIMGVILLPLTMTDQFGDSRALVAHQPNLTRNWKLQRILPGRIVLRCDGASRTTSRE